MTVFHSRPIAAKCDLDGCQVAELTAEVLRLRAALKPFALAAEYVEDAKDTDGVRLPFMKVCAGPLFHPRIWGVESWPSGLRRRI